MVTPMRADGSIDFDEAVALAKYLVEQGNDGLVISGTTGESPTTHTPEKHELIRVIRAALPDAMIVAGAGSNDTAHAVRMAEQAEDAGASALLSVVPYYSKPAQHGVVAHFTAIAEATDLPIMIYEIPGRTGIRLSAETLDALADRDTIVAVKDATGDVAAAKEHMERTGMAWYSGDDSLNLEFLRAGAAGMVSVVAHVASDRFAEMVAAVDAGDDARAQEISTELEPVVDAIMGPNLGAVYGKAAVQALGVISERMMRLPHLPLAAGDYDDLVASLKKAGIL